MSSPIFTAAPSAFTPLGGDPPVSQMFLLEVTGVQVGLFIECTGLSMTVEHLPLKEGGVNGYVHHLPGRVSWSNVTLKRGLTEDDAMMKWISQSDSSGQFDRSRSIITRTTAAITIVDRNGNRLRAWTLQDVFPVKWSGPNFSVTDNSAMTESLELAHHGFYATKPAASGGAGKPGSSGGAGKPAPSGGAGKPASPGGPGARPASPGGPGGHPASPGGHPASPGGSG